MNCQESIDFIYSVRGIGKKDGLRKITRLLHMLGDPQDQLRFVHVAGTNGKGSTTAMISFSLREAGYKTGMFISPYIINYRERIQINNELMPEEALCRCTEHIRPMVEQMMAENDCPNEFEICTAIAMYWFAQQHCDIVVLETGMGGLLDATNTVKNTLVSVITSIGLDHTQILGSTIPEITLHKCGIIKPGRMTVCYPDQDPEALAIIREQCAQKNNAFFMGSKDKVRVQHMALDGTDILYDGLKLHIPLLGHHQIYNCMNAVEALRCLRKAGFAISDAAIEAGVASTFFPARMEIVSRSPLIIVDGAHNPSGIQALCDALEMVPGRPVTLLMGMMADKDHHTALSMLAPRCRRVFTVTPSNPRSLSAEDLAGDARAFCPDAFPCASLEEGFDRALASLEPDGVLLICGSLYLASDLRIIAREKLGRPDNK